MKRTKKALEEMQQHADLYREAIITPLVLEGLSSDKPISEMVDVGFTYSEDNNSAFLLEDVNVKISGTDRILLGGPNGQGKSTLLKLVLGHLEPVTGEIRRHLGRVAYFPQDALPQLVRVHGNQSPTDFILHSDPNLTPTIARHHLGSFGLKGALATRQIHTLSAGQRVRLWLAREFLSESKKPSLLILDEVSENLDKETTDSLLTSIEGFGAAVIAISHDSYFREEFASTQVWHLVDGRLFVQFCGGE